MHGAKVKIVNSLHYFTQKKGNTTTLFKKTGIMENEKDTQNV